MINIESKKNQTFHLIYSIVLSICIIVSGLLLIISCINIYTSGEQPFSREAVANAFSLIAVPVYVCLILTIVGFIIDIFFVKDTPKAKPIKSYDNTLKIMYERRDKDGADSAILASIDRLVKRRTLHNILRIIVLTLCSIVFLIYALNDTNFHQSDINTSMIKAMYVLTPCLLIAFAYTLLTIYLNEKNIKAEIELYKQLPLKTPSDNNTVSDSTSGKAVKIAKYIILLLAVAFIIYGFISGGTADVLTKAINICTECIGLG